MTDPRDVAATMRRLKACVLIPTYNNAGTLGRVVSEVLEYSDDVIVVNDGSTDSTAEILKTSVKQYGWWNMPETEGREML